MPILTELSYDHLQSPVTPVAYPPGTCSHCGATEDVKLEDSRTAYEYVPEPSWKRLLNEDEGLGVPADPNAPVWLCRACAKLHHEYWDDMWDSYNSGRL